MTQLLNGCLSFAQKNLILRDKFRGQIVDMKCDWFIFRAEFTKYFFDLTKIRKKKSEKWKPEEVVDWKRRNRKMILARKKIWKRPCWLK